MTGLFGENNENVKTVKALQGLTGSFSNLLNSAISTARLGHKPTSAPVNSAGLPDDSNDGNTL